MSTRSKTAKTTTTIKERAAVKTPARKLGAAKEVSLKAEKTEVHEADTMSVLRKRELVDAAVSRSGVKKKDAKPVVEAVLAELATALAEGRELALQPLGRLKINREKELPDGRVIIAKLRQKNRQQP